MLMRPYSAHRMYPVYPNTDKIQMFNALFESGILQDEQSQKRTGDGNWQILGFEEPSTALDTCRASVAPFAGGGALLRPS